MRAIIMAVLALMVGAAWAQEVGGQNEPSRAQSPPPSATTPPTEGRAAVPQAPVGHRQPMAKDLPPDVLRREEAGEPQSPPGSPVRPPSICRDC